MRRHCQTLGHSFKDFQKLPQIIGTENCSTWIMRDVCGKVSSRSTVCFTVFVGVTLYAVLFLLPLRIFSPVFVFPHSLQLSWIFSTTIIICTFWYSKFQLVSTLTVRSWDNIFTQKWNSSSPITLSKCTKCPCMLSTSISIDWKLYLSWSNHLVTVFRLEMNVGGFSNHQNKTRDTGRYKTYFLTARVSQLNLNTMERFYGQWCKLQVTKCLIVHVESSC